MTKNRPLKWLHISDLHMGCHGEEIWWHVHKEFTKSLQKMVSLRGVPDLILVTGDIAWKGVPEDYEKMDDFLEKLFDWLGVRPLVIPVPGNHDLVRPDELWLLFYAVLDHFDKGNAHSGIKSLNEKLWVKKDVSFFTPLFGNYQNWLNSKIRPKNPSPNIKFHFSHFPGDFSAHITLPDTPPLTVVGLNSAWRHFGDLIPGKLEIFSKQLYFALNEGKNDFGTKLLLMHHPLDWLSVHSKKCFLEQIYLPDNFLAFLHGHMHHGDSKMENVAGAKPRYSFQAPSLFGLDKYGTANESRAFGYAWGELDHAGGIRVWPMKFILRGSGVQEFDLDPYFHGTLNDGVELRTGGSHHSTSPKTPSFFDVKQNNVEENKLEKEITDYRAWALAKYGRVSLIGTGGADLTLDLDKVYVPLRISQRSLLADSESHKKQRPHEVYIQQADGDVALKEVFRIGDGRHVALFGDPGAGKSTALRKLLHICLVEGGGALGLAENILPVFLRLRRFDESFLTKPLLAFLQNELDISSGHSLPAGLGERLWQRGGVLLLLDGLDEIASQELRAKVARKLDDALLNQRARGIYGALSCRYAGYGGKVRLGGAFLHLDVRPLDALQVADFVRLWFQEAHRCLPKGDAQQAEQEADKLLRNLGEARYANQQIKVLVGNPLLLTLLCVVVLQKYEIPRRRVEFYRQCLDVLLYRWRYLLEAEEPPLTLEVALSVLRKMAWQMHLHGRQYDMTELEFIKLSESVLEEQGKSLKEVDGGMMLRWFHVTCGVLEEYSSKHYGFMHLGFQEYLAAGYVASERQTMVNDLVNKKNEKWWKEVILLLAGLEDKDLFVRLVDALLL
ncbi:MAG: metallophosphoesterase, partial [Magnetococcus sp. DMHC-6]